MEIIRIKKNYTKIILLLIAGVIFGILCLNMFLNPNKYISFVFRSTSFIKSFGLIASILLFVSIILIATKTLKNKYGLILTEEGIIDLSSVVSIGLIHWKDIKGIKEKKVMSTEFLLIDLHNPNEYLDKAKNKLVLNLLKSNLSMYGTPIALSSVALQCSFHKLKTMLNDNYQKNLEKH
ncbi:STM3941 family protein [Flavobacterium sp.]|uniref:STM3941 family protein n=1 Tax=Flavobacterium sp. TaxID=239 RepID=UPI0025C49F03|nr:STM3941 family protein [Flavobacterium sp.]